MPRIDEQSGCLCFKIVFCGPGHGGKTTALRHAHRSLPHLARGELVTLATETDRTLFFDFFPFYAGFVKDVGRPVRFHLYTAPGQAFYSEACARVLREADGLVFVADSRSECGAANLGSLEQLRRSLLSQAVNAGDLPFVYLYNKRDLPDCAPVSQMKAALNPEGRPDFEGVATTGQGVFETLDTLCELVIDAHRRKGAP